MKFQMVVFAVVVGCSPDTGAGPPPLPPQANVAINKVGDGTGRVATSVIGIDCREACTTQEADLPAEATTTTLRLEPARDTIFDEVSCTASDGDTTELDPDNGATGVPETIDLGLIDDDGTLRDWTCEVSFTRVYSLSLLLSGSGTGRVVGNQTDGGGTPRLNCLNPDADCLGAYFLNETETITATADAGSVFTRFRNCGSGTDPLTFTVTSDISCVAQFDAAE
jgi:Divergent InlB B-repeat domain